jgi:hypothetical protein
MRIALRKTKSITVKRAFYYIALMKAYNIFENVFHLINYIAFNTTYSILMNSFNRQQLVLEF